jgi:hypothetical protein
MAKMKKPDERDAGDRGGIIKIAPARLVEAPQTKTSYHYLK